MIIFDPKSAYKHFKEARPEHPATWWPSSYAYVIPARGTMT